MLFTFSKPKFYHRNSTSSLHVQPSFNNPNKMRGVNVISLEFNKVNTTIMNGKPCISFFFFFSSDKRFMLRPHISFTSLATLHKIKYINKFQILEVNQFFINPWETVFHFRRRCHRRESSTFHNDRVKVIEEREFELNKI